MDSQREHIQQTSRHIKSPADEVNWVAGTITHPEQQRILRKETLQCCIAYSVW